MAKQNLITFQYRLVFGCVFFSCLSGSGIILKNKKKTLTGIPLTAIIFILIITNSPYMSHFRIQRIENGFLSMRRVWGNFSQTEPAASAQAN